MPNVIWRGRIAYDFISIPVRLYRGARREQIRFHYFHMPPRAGKVAVASSSAAKVFTIAGQEQPAAPGLPAVSDGAERVHQGYIGQDRGTLLSRDDLVLGCDVGRGKIVLLTPADFEDVRPPKSSELQITKFVPRHELHSDYLGDSYRVLPDEGGETLYYLFRRTLVDLCRVATGRLTVHEREHAVVILPGRRGLTLHTMFYSHELGPEEPPPDPVRYSQQELELSKALVNARSGSFDPADYQDHDQQRLWQLIVNRSGESFPFESEDIPSRLAPVVDIEDELRRSLEMRKPPKAERSGSGPGRGRKRKRPRANRLV